MQGGGASLWAAGLSELCYLLPVPDIRADRSPCGTGTSAKLATLYKWGEIGVGEPFVYESFMGSLFEGEIKEVTKVADYDAVVPKVTGSCYLTGVATYLIDGKDPLKYGFLIG